MIKEGQKERLVGDIVRTVSEAVDLGDLGSNVLPLLDALLDTSTSLLYRYNERGEMVPIAGNLSSVVPIYGEEYFENDPLQDTLRQFNPILLQASKMPNWEEYAASPAYNECAVPNGANHFLRLRISHHGMYEEGMVAIILARNFRQPDFNERERILVGSLIPSLETFARRNERLEERLKAQPFVESLLEGAQGPTVVLDAKGTFVWASERAEALLGIGAKGSKGVPEALEKAAFRLGELLEKKSKFDIPPAKVDISRGNESPLRGELRLTQSRNGAYCVVAEFEDPEGASRLAEIIAPYKLSKAETQVLKLISLGLSDREIAARQFVSPATVHSHVNRILSKLGVTSRLQAALIAHGRKKQPL